MKKFFSLLLIAISFTVQAQDLKSAIALIDREQYSKALSILIQLKQKEARNTDLNFYIGDIYFRNEQYDSAKYWFMEGVKANENAALCYVGLGKVNFKEDPTEAKANFDKAIAVSKKNGTAAAYICEFYTTKEKSEPEKALEYGYKAVESDSKNLKFRIFYGDAYLESHNGTQAIDQYKAALSIDATSPLPLWKIGKLYLSAKNYDLGMQYFKDGLSKDSLFGPIYREMGELYYKANKFDKAIDSYKKYLQLRDKNDDANFRYASFLYFNKDYPTAIAILNDLKEKNFANPIIYRLMGYSYYETKEYDKALSSMDEVWKKIESKKIITQDYEFYGKILAKKGQDSLAVNFIQQALEKDTSKKELYGEMAGIWFLAKKYNKAAEAYKKKIQILGPSMKVTQLANDYLVLGKSYMYDKQFSAADSAFTKVTELKPELIIGYSFRAQVNALMDPKQEKGLAKPFYEKIIELAKAEPEKNKADLLKAYKYLGSYYYLVEKDKTKFEEAWNNVRAIDPNDAAAAEAAKVKFK